MSYEREQKLINLCFELVQTVHRLDLFQNKGTEEVMEWVGERLLNCGFPTTPTDSSWGVLVKEETQTERPVLSEGALRSTIKDQTKVSGTPATIPPAPKPQEYQTKVSGTPVSTPPAPKQMPVNEDKYASVLSKIYGALLEQNRLTENLAMAIGRMDRSGR